MAYHDELLSQALDLVHTAPSTQASLRRAVSSAYYAVFHLLIADAASNWNNVKLRAALGRAFDHGIMRTASNRLSNTRDFPFTGEDPQVVASLRFVALTFTQLQEDRHSADYDLTEDLDSTDALHQVKSAEKIFTTWPTIRSAQIAQEYLVSLVVKRR
jgi:uncharacterized protein (UPF0332 family)